MLDEAIVKDVIARALAEDIGRGDITSELLIPADQQAEMAFVAREEMVVCGSFIPKLVYEKLDANIAISSVLNDGDIASHGKIIVSAKGSARALLAGERVSLNIMQRMCGVVTLTKHYVDAIKGTKAIILDTRKTIPNLRVLDKYSVTIGGGKNHRMRLDDMVLIKDNHIALCGNIAKAVTQARAGTKLPIIVECDTLEQLQEVLISKPDRILLDNMDTDTLKKAVIITAGKIPLEASGGVNLSTVRAIAETGADYISVGALTHSARAMDIGADIKFI